MLVQRKTRVRSKAAGHRKGEIRLDMSNSLSIAKRFLPVTTCKRALPGEPMKSMSNGVIGTAMLSRIGWLQSEKYSHRKRSPEDSGKTDQREAIREASRLILFELPGWSSGATSTPLRNAEVSARNGYKGDL